LHWQYFDANLCKCVNVSNAKAITQFYFAIPNVIKDTAGITFSVDADSKVFSWIENGMGIVPANINTPIVEARGKNIDLDANEYLLAINDNLDIGTRYDTLRSFSGLFARYNIV